MTEPDAGRSADPHLASSRRHQAPIAWLLLIFAAVAGMRLLLVRSLPLNSDEPQHLHVVWIWTQGLLPYRDVFDNHTPLFQMLAAPVLSLLGDSPSTLTWMRVAMLPWTLLALLCLWWLGRALWPTRIATWAVAIAGFFPAFFAIAGQFRPDAMWACAWLGALALAFSGHWSRWRAFCFGVLVGTCFSISFKSTLLIGGLVLAWGMIQFALPADRRVHLRDTLRSATLILAGALVLPAALVAYFALHGALDQLLYCVIGHNIVPGLGSWSGHAWKRWLLPMVVLGVACLVRRWCHVQPRNELAMRRVLLGLSALCYYLLLYGVWPLFTRQDRMAALPLVCLWLTGWMAGKLQNIRREAWTFAALVVLEIALLLRRWPPTKPQDVAFRAYVHEVLARTRPGEYVMDAKGESLFRPRPFYYALEGITRHRIQLGLIRDDIAQRLVATRTRLVATNQLTPDAETFVSQHYVTVAPSIRIAGARVPLRGEQAQDVDIAIPGIYALQPVPTGARIDGLLYRGPVRLAAGSHVVSAMAACDCLLLSQPPVVGR